MYVEADGLLAIILLWVCKKLAVAGRWHGFAVNRTTLSMEMNNISMWKYYVWADFIKYATYQLHFDCDNCNSWCRVAGERLVE